MFCVLINSLDRWQQLSSFHTEEKATCGPSCGGEAESREKGSVSWARRSHWTWYAQAIRNFGMTFPAFNINSVCPPRLPPLIICGFQLSTEQRMGDVCSVLCRTASGPFACLPWEDTGSCLTLSCCHSDSWVSPTGVIVHPGPGWAPGLPQSNVSTQTKFKHSYVTVCN